MEFNSKKNPAKIKKPSDLKAIIKNNNVKKELAKTEKEADEVTSDAIFQRKIKEIREQKGADYILSQKEVSDLRKESEEETLSTKTPKIEINRNKPKKYKKENSTKEVQKEEVQEDEKEEVEKEDTLDENEDAIEKEEEEIEKEIEAEIEEVIPVTQISPEKMKRIEEILGEAEAKKAIELESSKFKNGILKGLSKWEKFGLNEKGGKEPGVKGFAKRMTKAAINLAMIGAISMVAVDQLAIAHIGTASALAGGVTSKLGIKMAFGLSIAGALDVTGKKMSEKTQKRMPLYLAIGGVAAAIGISALSGAGLLAAGGAGTVAGLAAGAGWAASKFIKGKFTDEKIAMKKESAIKELFQKYTDENGEVEISRVPELEADLAKVLKKFENQKIWGKLSDGAMKLGVGSLISGIVMEAGGAVQDHVKADHIADLKHEAEVKHEMEHLKQEHLKQEHQNEGGHEKDNHTTEGPEVFMFKPVTVSFNPHGAIATINDLKAEIHHEYPDITKAPESVQEFIKGDSINQAIKLGLYDPNNPNEAESAMLNKDSILGFDQRGDLFLRDSHTGQAEFLMQTKDGVETITKFDGKMFDSDNSGIKTETLNENPQELPNTNNPTEQTTTEPVNPSVTTTTPETTPIDNRQPGSTQPTPVIQPEVKTIDYKFDNPNHIVQILEDNGGKGEMQFIYDSNNKIIGVDITGNYNINAESYADQLKIHELSIFQQIDANKDILQMAKEAAFLEKLPHNTTEYQHIYEDVTKMQNDIIKNYGDIINHDKLIINNNETTPNQTIIDNKVEPVIQNTETLILNLHNNNIEHLFPQNNKFDIYWDDVKNLKADVIYDTKPEAVVPKYQELYSYMHKINEATGLTPKDATITTSAENIKDFFNRAEAEAIKIGKVDAIKL